jgi:hypothetical protein
MDSRQDGYPLYDAACAHLEFFRIHPEYSENALKQLLIDCGLRDYELNNETCTDKHIANFRHVLGIKNVEDLHGYAELHAGDSISGLSFNRPLNIQRFARPTILEGTSIMLKSFEQALELLSNSDAGKISQLTSSVGFRRSRELIDFSSYLKTLLNNKIDPLVIWILGDHCVYSCDVCIYTKKNEILTTRYTLVAEIVYNGASNMYLKQAWVPWSMLNLNETSDVSTTDAPGDPSDDEDDQTFDARFARMKRAH